MSLGQNTRVYSPDSLKLGPMFAGIAAAIIGSGVFTLGMWWILKQTSLPAFSTSNVTKALASAGTLMVLIAVGVLVGMWLFDEHASRPHPRWRVITTYVVTYLSPAALVVTALAIPLSATRLFLDGLQVDQGFRTQFLTRMAQGPSYADMNYADMPTYYPLGWFWLGGRLAQLLNLDGWEVYQPWALISMAMAGSALVPIWQKITGSLPIATAISLVNTAIVLVMASEEPYAAVVALFAPAALVLLHSALRGSYLSTLALTLFLGYAASFYTLFTGVIAVSIVIVALIFALGFYKDWVPIKHLAIIGFGSIAIALIAWGPYLSRVLTGSEQLESTAMNYLPAEGSTFPLPFLAPSVVGVLCLIGLIYMVLKFHDPIVRTLALTTLAFYGWAIASMMATLIGRTLLGFRIDTLITLVLATAGVLALAELRLEGIRRLFPDRMTTQNSKKVTAAFLVLLLAGGLAYGQQIPAKLETALDHAYQDTDGYGERADRFTPDSSSYFGEVNEHLIERGFIPNETVVLTDETRFLSFFPYYGFNGFTSHYANPLGEFTLRNDAIAAMAESSWDEDMTPTKFKQQLDELQWRAPEVFLFRANEETTAEDGGWKTHIAHDIYPNQPNVRFEATFFNPEVFEQGWHIEQIGPFVVVSADA